MISGVNLYLEDENKHYSYKADINDNTIILTYYEKGAEKSIVFLNNTETMEFLRKIIKVNELIGSEGIG